MKPCEANHAAVADPLSRKRSPRSPTIFLPAMDCARITDNLFAGSWLLDLKDPAANLVATVPTLVHRRLGIEVLIPTGLLISRAQCV